MVKIYGEIVKHQTYDLIREISLKNNQFVCGLLEHKFDSLKCLLLSP